MRSTLLGLEGLTKRYGALTAVKDLTLGIREGEILGLLGPNGAGKATTILMVCGLLKPDAGTIALRGAPVDARDRRTIARAAVIANFPLLLMLFFSNAMFPLPGARLFAVGEWVIHLQDVLPQTHAVAALNKVFSLGLGLREVTFEMVSLVVLAVAYFLAGVWPFRRMHLRANRSPPGRS